MTRLAMLLVLASLLAAVLAASAEDKPSIPPQKIPADGEDMNACFEVENVAGFFWTYKNGWIPANSVTLEKGDIVRFDGGVLTRGEDRRLASLNSVARCAFLFEYSGASTVHVSGSPIPTRPEEPKGADFVMKLSVDGKTAGLCTNARSLLADAADSGEYMGVTSLSLLFPLTSEDVVLLSKFPMLRFLNVAVFAGDAGVQALTALSGIELVAVQGEITGVLNAQAVSAMNLRYIGVRVASPTDAAAIKGVLSRAHTAYVRWDCTSLLFTDVLPEIPANLTNLTMSFPLGQPEVSVVLQWLKQRHLLSFFGLCVRLGSEGSRTSEWSIDSKALYGLKGASIELVARDIFSYENATGPTIEFEDNPAATVRFLDLRNFSINASNLLFPRVSLLLCRKIGVRKPESGGTNFPALKALVVDRDLGWTNLLIAGKSVTLLSGVGSGYGVELVPSALETYVVPRRKLEYVPKGWRMLAMAKKIIIIWDEASVERKCWAPLPDGASLVVFGGDPGKSEELPKALKLWVSCPMFKDLCSFRRGATYADEYFHGDQYAGWLYLPKGEVE